MYRIVRDSRTTDALKGREYDPTEYVDTPFLISLQQKQRNKCHHCGIFMNWLERRSQRNGLTLERLDNALPHVRSNCVLACKSCNSQKLSREKSLLRKYFNIWYHKTFSVVANFKGERRACFA